MIKPEFELGFYDYHRSFILNLSLLGQSSMTKLS